MSTAPPPSLSTSDTRRRLLDELRRGDVDVTAARARVEARVGARRRRQRIAAGATGSAALLIVLVVATFALDSRDPDDVVADRDDRTTTTSAPASTTTIAQQVIEPEPPVETTAAPTTSAAATAAPVTVAPVTVAPAVPSNAVPSNPPPSPPPTRAANAPMTAQLTVATPRVSAGSTSAIDVTWSDRDHSGPAPTYLVDWGDPAVTALTPPAPAGSCDRPGQPAADTDRLEFRHATPGRHRIRVEVRTCARGEFAERLVLEGTIEVSEPELEGTPAVAVVLHREDAATPGLLLPALDAAAARLAGRLLPERSPVLSQRVGQGAATVVVVPRDADGPLELTWPSTDCRATASVDLVDAEPTGAPRFLLSSSC